ncbi:MAG TPA: hypothetical protein ENI87_09560 [bacterium]|nr:hypothetical protein [bacterium]
MALAATMAAQDAAGGDGITKLALRVASVRPNGQCIIDRGRRDKVMVDDRVILSPRGGQPLPGRVVQVENRTALVRLLDPKAKVVAGVRGYVLLPKERVQKKVRQRPDGGVPAGSGEGEAGQSAQLADQLDQAGEEEWRPGMPLLGRHRAPRPDERPSRLRGRVYGSGNLVRTLDSFSQSFLATGADVDINNVGGRGGRLRFHGEYFRSKEFNDKVRNDLRLYELSYERGGTRFDPVHWQVGRFLPRDMPEFGVLDGATLGYRQENGSRFGGSVGFLPELDDDMQTFADFQLALWYVWNQDVAERLSFAMGYQKTWHRGRLDRDLVILRSRYLPTSGWDVSASAWVDIYDANDVLKNEAFEVTRANVFASRRWQGQGGVEWFYDHEEYPELRRNENPQVLLPQTLIGAYVDRVSSRLWLDSGSGASAFARLTAWVDEETVGGAVEVGGTWADLWGDGSTTTVAGFHIEAPSNNVTGVRLQHGVSGTMGRLDLLYELGFVHFDDQPSDVAELLQHRLGVLLATDIGRGWDANFTVDTTLWDTDASFALGFYLQRLF